MAQNDGNDDQRVHGSPAGSDRFGRRRPLNKSHSRARVYRHSTRLLDRAARNGVGTTGWVTDDARSIALATCHTGAFSGRSATQGGGLVAVVSDGSGLGVAVDRRSVARILRKESDLIGALTGLAVIMEEVTAGDAAQLVDAVGELPGAVGAIFLTDVEAERAQEVQRAVAECGGPVVFTDPDAAAIAVTASLLTAPARADGIPDLSRVVIAGAPTVPLLRPFLIAAGIGEIDSWNAAGIVGFGLDRIADGADAVIDLVGCPPGLGPCCRSSSPPAATTTQASRYPACSRPPFGAPREGSTSRSTTSARLRWWQPLRPPGTSRCRSRPRRRHRRNRDADHP
jgi:hypothetical protein